MFPFWFTLLGGSFVFLDVGPSNLFLVFPLFWLLWFLFHWHGFIIIISKHWLTYFAYNPLDILFRLLLLMTTGSQFVSLAPYVPTLPAGFQQLCSSWVSPCLWNCWLLKIPTSGTAFCSPDMDSTKHNVISSRSFDFRSVIAACQGYTLFF